MDKKDNCLHDILEALKRMAKGDFSRPLYIPEQNIEIDCVDTGIKVLAKELKSILERKESEMNELRQVIAALNRNGDKLCLSEKLFRKVFQLSPDIITISRLSDGVFVEVNRSFETATGYPKEELIGKSVFEIGMWPDPRVREEMVREILEKGNYHNLETNLKVRDGKIKTALLSATVIEIDDEPHLLTVSRDITELREAEERVRSSEEKYGELIRLAPSGIIVLNRSGVITMVNPAFCRISGYSEKELVDKHFSRYKGFLKKDVPKFTRIFDDMIKGEIPGTVEIEWFHKNGTLGYADVNIAPLHMDGKISGIQAIITDTTERVRTIQALRSSESQYRTSMDAMIDSVYVINREREIILANQSLVKSLEYLGFSGDIAGKKIDQALPFLPSSISGEYQNIFRTGEPVRKEVEFTSGSQVYYTDAHLIPIHEEGKISRVLTVVQDITERKKAENIQKIMHNISNAVDDTKNLNELFHVIQQELGQVFDTTNFFIALYNRDDDTLSLPYFVDQKDHFEIFPAKKTLTGYVIKNDRPLLMKDRDIGKLVSSGEVDDVGTPSKIWLGVPLKIRDEIIGALVVQHYENEHAYTDQDLEILKFVSTQISFNIQSKRAYDEIQLEKAYFEQLFQSSPETIVVTDNDGKLLRVNREFEKLFGYSREEAIGEYADRLVVPESHLTEAEQITRLLARGERIRVETVREHKDGHLLDVSLLGTPVEISSGQVAVYGIYRDITDRKKAEQELETSRKQYRMITELTSDFAYSYHVGEDHSLQLDWVGGALKELTGYALEEIKEAGGWPSLIFPEDAEITYRQLDSLLQNKSSAVEYRMITKSGRIIWVSDSANPVWDEKTGRVISIYGAIKDITERRQFEESLKIAKEKAEQSDRLKSAFLANMSHEIRTPMNAILGFSELIRNDDLSKEDREEYIRIIKNKGNELLLLINDIVDISKIEAGDINIMNRDINLGAFLLEIHAQAEEEKSMIHKAHLQIRLNLPDHLEAVINTDQVRLGQVMNNLINNALKFTLEGYIELGYHMIENTSVQIYVKDTGIGIAADKQEIIFDRFRQSDESISSEFGGTGLGLAISRNLVSLLGGEILVDSSPGMGSRFFFSLPLKEIRKKGNGVIVKAEKPEDRSSLLDLTSKKIMIAEDDTSNYMFLESYLKKTGAGTVWARDGEQAVEIINSGERIDLIFMDIRMPNMNGIDATVRIREQHERIPIIALTAYAFTDDRERALKAGCNTYLCKPVRVEQLNGLLSDYLLRSSGSKAPE